MITTFASGRINLIGEHTDYNQGFCIPLTLGVGITASIKIIAEKLVRLSSDYEDSPVVHSFGLFDRWEKKGHWTDYCLGVIIEARKQFPINQGFEIKFSSNLPASSGLSSSAALEVCTLRALAAVFGFSVSPTEIAILSQAAENKFAGVNCGILDQLAIAEGHTGFCLFVDTRDLSVKTFLFQPPKGYLVVINSQLERTLAASAYNTRRLECEQAVQEIRNAGLWVDSLRDVNELNLNNLIENPVLHKRAKHVVSENSRVIQCWEAIQQKKWSRVGELWDESHRSLQQDYEVSCAAVDFLVSEIQAIPGTLGCRMTGAGFGGCVIALTPPEQLKQHWHAISAQYQQKFGLKPRIIDPKVIS